MAESYEYRIPVLAALFCCLRSSECLSLTIVRAIALNAGNGRNMIGAGAHGARISESGISESRHRDRRRLCVNSL